MVDLNRFWFFFKKIDLIIFFNKNQIELKIITLITSSPCVRQRLLILTIPLEDRKALINIRLLNVL